MQHCQHTYRNKRFNSRSFTIIELLITAGIFAVVSVAIYTTFNSGIRVWRSVKDADIAEARNLIKFEKLNRELRQAFNFQDIAFAGTNEQIEFPQVIDSDITRVTYLLDAGKKNLSRSQIKLKDILEAQSPEPGAIYFTNIEKFNLSYLYFDLEKSAYSWKESWEGPGLPFAVKIDISIDGKTYASTVFIPAA
ncbi:MAG: type II secretion system protein GspJ [Candidatus Omnitrophota bacterium]